MNQKRLSSLGTFKNGLNFSKETAQGTGCKILGVGDFGENVYMPTDGLEEISSDYVKEDDLIQEKDILFVRSNGNKALVGRMMLAKNIQDDICFSGFCIRFRPNKEEIDPEYLFYMLKSSYCRKQYTPSQQTNITNLSQDRLGAVLVPVLENPNEEKEHVNILSMVDRKIEINRMICSELVSIAKTLYDYWFVQFDFPNENGKPYRSSGGAMEWSEELKQEIPKGWNTGPLSDIADITMGQSPPGDTYNDDGEGIQFYQGSTDFGAFFPTPRVYTTSPSRYANYGDILMSVRAPVGAWNIAMDNCCIGRGLAALHNKTGAQLYLIQVIEKYRGIFEIMNGNGTTFGSVNSDELSSLKTVIPPSSIRMKYNMIADPIEKEIKGRELEVRELTRLRDWLLPMLMNGQATVSSNNSAAKSITQQRSPTPCSITTI